MKDEAFARNTPKGQRTGNAATIVFVICHASPKASGSCFGGTYVTGIEPVFENGLHVGTFYLKKKLLGAAPATRETHLSS